MCLRRSFLRRLFFEQTPAAEAYKGLAWLFLGVAGTENLLYDADWQQTKAKYPNNFRLDYALSREMTNKAGGKMYIQDKVEEYSDEIFTRMDKGAHMYFCGLKGMMPGACSRCDACCVRVLRAMYQCLITSGPPFFCRPIAGILEMFEGVCKKKGIDWPEKLKHWKEEGQWHVEVY